ncbi:hypothetical protein ON010_g9495 [Phytophthora cinnamomi]|nr:hypothetical protein ON010_g9495 [Phytophthora cinnamomi]
MVGSNALSSTLSDDLAGVNHILDDLDKPHDLLIRTGSPLAIVMDKSSTTRSDRNDSDASRGTGENESINKRKTCPSRTARHRRIYRRTQKLGREELRRQVIELNDKLLRLKQTQAKEKEGLQASRSASFYFWKSVALRQLEERRLIEAEQRQLIAAVNTQTTYIDILSNIAHTDVMTVVGLNDFSSLSPSYCPKMIEAALYDACIRELNTNYARADEVLATCVFGELKPNITVRSELKRESDGQLEYHQRLTKEVQPFSLYETGCFLWDAMERYHTAKVAYKRHEHVKDPENTYAITYTDNVTLRTGEVVVVRQRLILRRFFEDERIVFIWKVISEGQGIAEGTYQEDMGWVWLYPLTDTMEPGTIRATCSRRSPMHYSSTVTEDINCEFERMLQEHYEEASEEIASSLDQLLLDDALATADV